MDAAQLAAIVEELRALRNAEQLERDPYQLFGRFCSYAGGSRASSAFLISRHACGRSRSRARVAFCVILLSRDDENLRFIQARAHMQFAMLKCCQLLLFELRNLRNAISGLQAKIANNHFCPQKHAKIKLCAHYLCGQ